MTMIGAGGSQGGMLRFFIGFVMFVAGFYLLLKSVLVTNIFGHGLFSMGGLDITTGYVLIPFLFGVGMVFYDSDNYLGWLLAGISIIMMVFGVITSVKLTFHNMNLFKMLTILILMFGGAGLWLSSLKQLPKETE